jgi:antitoxin component YwqK of YwqJK toxin-antitoxin module
MNIMAKNLNNYQIIMIKIYILILGLFFSCFTEVFAEPSVRVITVDKTEVKNDLRYEIGQITPFTGLVRGMYTNGKKEIEINYKEGKKEGVQTSWDEKGNKRLEVNYKNGKSEGLLTTWYENGQKKGEVNYENGKLQGVGITWHENGKKRSELNYNRKKNGLFTEWYENGKKKIEVNYKEGKKQGLEIIWYNNGKKKSEASYKDGEKHGLQTEWDEKGKKSETMWDKGNRKIQRFLPVKGLAEFLQIQWGQSANPMG